MNQDQREIRRRKRILDHAEQTRCVVKDGFHGITKTLVWNCTIYS